ncbi:MAG: RAMP superfamily CRISPR-associated protein [Candidatus Methanomethylicaceae archaeon]
MELHLNPLENKIIGIIKFSIQTPIHIGTGGTEVKREFLKVKDNLLIPSSTWKGIFRSLSEKIAKNMNFNYLSNLAIKLYKEKERGIEYKPTNNIEKNEFNKLKEELKKVFKGMESEIVKFSKENINELINELGFSDEKELLEKEDEETWIKFTEAILAINCPIGKIYGNNYLASKVRFLDTFIPETKIHERSGTTIERNSGKVKEKHLYFTEVYIGDKSIEMFFIADNLKQGEDDSKVFSSILNYVKEMGINIGGSISRGLGYLKLEDAKFYIIDLKEGKYENRILSLVNPFKNVTPISIDEFIKWLKGS